MDLYTKIVNREEKISLVGLGYVGMPIAVAFAKKGKEFGYWVPLLFAVPLFIHCGFPHCIADAFYYLTAADYIVEQPHVLWCYLATVIGNFVGCNVPRMNELAEKCNKK